MATSEKVNLNLALESAIDQFLHTGNRWTAIQTRLLEQWPDLNEADIDTIKSHLDYMFEQFKIRIDSFSLNEGKLKKKALEGSPSSGPHSDEDIRNWLGTQEVKDVQETKKNKIFKQPEELPEFFNDEELARFINTEFPMLDGIIFDLDESSLKTAKDTGIVSLVAKVNTEDLARLTVNLRGKSIAMSFTGKATPENISLFKLAYETLKAQGYTMEYPQDESLGIEHAPERYNKKTDTIEMTPNLEEKYAADFAAMLFNISHPAKMTDQEVYQILIPYYGTSWGQIKKTLRDYPGLLPAQVTGILKKLFTDYRANKLSEVAFKEQLDSEMTEAQAKY